VGFARRQLHIYQFAQFGRGRKQGLQLCGNH
jgi:hypothetical protein